MPKYQTLKAKFAVHLNLAKDCMDTFNRTSIDRLCAIEQDLATGAFLLHLGGIGNVKLVILWFHLRS